ncbi:MULTISPECIES: bifunctional biotin--[acetyl-CoA-carboxylase] ligase/biotin operon repressor BirA [unclassified Pseudomonas]|uniref:bifunctional biotin--[acetyl-CoA-carboxylase] ligase/biotin operon repressor BirA n=1 Tax=unclassified Pseudomonas TaxID=196821 RepID=UPI002AC8AE31|nr:MULTISPECIES: bifunctional biotin--[acetyl-CoA-carboxylase] ligase/biotin operon repressor BirA [unclassified Pseudomonas]MEB0042672.1 bifunctional biotin--[acetyl-CoA-carboxylase] ligase/biotin operon repressor BirA [Pseudomonas sp. MH10]MEB0079880.1 bifunctional biotin--[acetyl-CoA-carboxylase] ligase/biotin operon repressor BirA [Pseudomonas sp. MH10out]MEB0093167.1 bifunctional biotin--[acetyl-CoA-carboxylase] ligase/biotin operon repressor BirA [Pseudomonas sp. CCI4.2]MEB0104240.1 bifun
MLTLLKLLKDGTFHSGQALGLALGISRSAVWKQLQQLEAELGIEIHKVRGRGYRLATPISLLSQDEILSSGSSPGWPVYVFDSIDSTNAEAMRLIGRGQEMPALVLAERQTAGRGRRGRKWISPFAENIYYSLALRVEGGMRQLEGLSLVVGLAVLHVLGEIGVKDAGLKWPNDILVGQRKLAGVLLELVGDPADICHVVVGVGINVNMKAAPEVDQLWTSIRLETGVLTDRNELVAHLNASLMHYFNIHLKGGFTALRAEWEQNHLWQGRSVTLLAGTNKIDGIVLGVDARGALRLQVAGEEEVFSGGELSLRLRDDT